MADQSISMPLCGGLDAIGFDPRDGQGPFSQLLQDVRRCKVNQSCPALHVRQYYWEPNPETANEWSAEGRYTGDLDRRAVFVCESPSAIGGGTDSADVKRNWAPVEFRARRLWDALGRYGLGSSYITDAAKCGVRRGRQHSDAEIEACAPFLAREIDPVQPMVVVGVGHNATRVLKERLSVHIVTLPVLFQVTHYSMQGNPWADWDREFPELLRLLDRLRPRSEWPTRTIAIPPAHLAAEKG
jgi:uracil-DNA glycosylase family 4